MLRRFKRVWAIAAIHGNAEALGRVHAAIGERLGTVRRKEIATLLREAVAQVGKKLG